MVQWGRQGADIWLPDGLRPIEHARNAIGKRFLEEGDWTHLLMVDSDTVPPPFAMKQMVEDDKDVVTGVTNVERYDANKREWFILPMTCIRGQAPDGTVGLLPVNGVGLKRIHACGASCLMIKRGVLAKLPKPWFVMSFDEEGLRDQGEDFYFSASVVAAGMDLFADFRIRCKPWKEKVI